MSRNIRNIGVWFKGDFKQIIAWLIRNYKLEPPGTSTANPGLKKSQGLLYNCNSLQFISFHLNVIIIWMSCTALQVGVVGRLYVLKVVDPWRSFSWWQSCTRVMNYFVVVFFMRYNDTLGVWSLISLDFLQAQTTHCMSCDSSSLALKTSPDLVWTLSFLSQPVFKLSAICVYIYINIIKIYQVSVSESWQTNYYNDSISIRSFQPKNCVAPGC
jgi:hypothetical protein